MSTPLIRVVFYLQNKTEPYTANLTQEEVSNAEQLFRDCIGGKTTQKTLEFENPDKRILIRVDAISSIEIFSKSPDKIAGGQAIKTISELLANKHF